MTTRLGKPNTRADLKIMVCIARKPRNFIVVAGAGSGKTTSLIKALGYIELQHGARLAQAGQKVACITYTEVATDEIRTDLGDSPLFHVSTIHSFLWSLIKSFQVDIRSSLIDRLLDRIEKTKEEERMSGPRTRQATRDKRTAEIGHLQEVVSELNRVEEFSYGTGSDYLQGVLGHSDILKLATDLLKTKPLLRKIVGQRFPFIMIDESQDTNKDVVEALLAVSRDAGGACCIGFFGDPMQKIYMDGLGEIVPGQDDLGWVKIKKPQNYRCPTSVLKVINAIRLSKGDLQQTIGRTREVDGEIIPVEGTARLFVLPIDDRRPELLDAVRKWSSKKNSDPCWLENSSDANVKILVISHRMAATRLGFGNLYASLHDKAPARLSENILDGTAWPVRPFVQYLLPLVSSLGEARAFDTMRLLRKNCPHLKPENLKQNQGNVVLKSLKNDLERLCTMFDDEEGSTIGDVLHFVDEAGVGLLGSEFHPHLANWKNESLSSETEITNSEDSAVRRFLRCRAKELSGYGKYLENESPFATQHGIKGAEFDRVLVVLDDEEGRHNLYSYNRFFGLIPPTDSETENIAEGKETVSDRTQRLFYVCCSRAKQDLVVTLFTKDPDQAAEHIRSESTIFDPSNIHTLVDLLEID